MKNKIYSIYGSSTAITFDTFLNKVLKFHLSIWVLINKNHFGLCTSQVLVIWVHKIIKI